MTNPFARSLALASVLIALTSAGALAAGTTPPFIGLIQQGHLQVGGSASLSTYISSTNGNSTDFFLYPEAEYFLTDRLSMGGTVTLQVSSSSGFTSTYWEIGPSATYYFALLSERTALYGKAGFGIAGSSSTGYRSTTSGSITAGVGLDYFLTPSVSIGPSVDWRLSGGNNLFSLAGAFRIFL